MTSRPNLSDQTGAMIIEVMVSALLMITIAVTVFGALDASGRAGAQERHRARAYAIAQEDQARVRSLKVSDLTRLSQTRTVVQDGTTYTVTSTGTPKIDRTATSACESGNTSADFIAISSTVNWSSNTGRTPVVVESLVAPPNGSLEADRGALAVSVVDSRPNAVPNITVSGTGASSFSGVTSTAGCVIFGDLLAGNYTVTPALPGFVDKDGNPPVGKLTTVVGQSSNSLSFQYDRGGTIRATFTTTRPGSTAAVASSADTMLVYNPGMTQPERFGTLGTDAQIQTATPLFPFTSPDSFYAGGCTTNNPNAPVSPNPAAPLAAASVLVPVNGTAATQTIRLPALALTVRGGTSSTSQGNLINAARVTATDMDCSITGTPYKKVMATNATGTLAGTSATSADNPGLPYGIDYDICVSGLSSAGTVKRVIRNDVALTSATAPTNLGVIYLNTGVAGPCP